MVMNLCAEYTDCPDHVNFCRRVTDKTLTLSTLVYPVKTPITGQVRLCAAVLAGVCGHCLSYGSALARAFIHGDTRRDARESDRCQPGAVAIDTPLSDGDIAAAAAAVERLHLLTQRPNATGISCL